MKAIMFTATANFKPSQEYKTIIMKLISKQVRKTLKDKKKIQKF